MNQQFLISPADLEKKLQDPNVRVYDATVFLTPGKTGYTATSGLAKYNEGHVQGAAFLDLLSDFSDTSTGLGFSLPTPQALAEAMGKAGMSNDNEVVFYSTGGMMWATRAWWLANYAGHQNIAVLDGGWQRWRDEGRAQANAATQYASTTFTPNAQPQFFASEADVRNAIDDGQVCTINALSTEMYEGTGDHHYGRRGHIPGSEHLFYDDLMTDGSFHAPDKLAKALTAKGALGAQRVITYCGGGIAATVDAFACLLCGQQSVAVYDGSMSEWVRNDSNPLITGNIP